MAGLTDVNEIDGSGYFFPRSKSMDNLSDRASPIVRKEY